MSSALVDRHGDDLDLWLLPAMPYSKSNEHAWSAGSVWFGPETMLRMLDDLGRSIATLPAERLVFLNGHGGNSSLLNVACRELRLHHGLRTFLAHPAVPPDQGGASSEVEHGMGIHGGLRETSMMLHLRPDLVDMDAAGRRIPEGLVDNRHVRFGGTVSFGWLSNDWSEDGYIGDATGANAAQGEADFDAAVTQLAEAMAEVRDFDPDRIRTGRSNPFGRRAMGRPTTPAPGALGHQTNFGNAPHTGAPTPMDAGRRATPRRSG